MKKAFRTLLYIVSSLLGLAFAAYVMFWLVMAWHMWPRSYTRADAEFYSVAVKSLEDSVCGPLPSDIQVTHYYRKNNFNDGDELWLLESQSADAIAGMVERLHLEPMSSTSSVGQWLGVLDDKPNWVIRPDPNLKWLFVDASNRPVQPAELSKICKFGRFFLWSRDGQTFFLSHIIT